MYYINKEIGFEPTKVIKKGQSIAINLKARETVWIYKVKFCENTFIEKLYYFLNKLYESVDFFTCKIKQYEHVSIDFFIRSNDGQIGYILPKNAIISISKLDIDINFHILSFGEASV